MSLPILLDCMSPGTRQWDIRTPSKQFAFAWSRAVLREKKAADIHKFNKAFTKNASKLRASNG